MRATLNGDRLHPIVVLRCAHSAPHAHTAQPLRDWIAGLPQAERREDGDWLVSATGPAPDRQLRDAGFHVLGPDGNEWPLREYASPLAVPGNSPDTIAIYPRLAGREATRALLPASARWSDENGAFLCVGLTSLPDGIIGPPVVTSVSCDNPSTEAPRSVGTLDYDLTVDGLRGVPVSDLSCVTSAAAEAMNAYGIDSVYDLLHHIPHRYIDRSNPTQLGPDLVGQKIAVTGTVTGVSNRARMGMVFVRDAAGASLTCKWFNAAWLVKRFSKGDEVLLYGKLESWDGDDGVRYSITNPLADIIGADADPMLPVYRQSSKADLSTWQLHRASKEAVGRLGDLIDPVPAALLTRRRLIPRGDALLAVHQPDSTVRAVLGRDRLAYDELLRLQMSVRIESAIETSPAGIAHIPTGDLEKQLLAAMPFDLTRAQERVIDEIRADMVSPRPMNRLLQGEVGSGKTAVALLAMLTAIESGYQAAMMAPTEILATQHHTEITERLADVHLPDGSPVTAVLLTNKITGAVRRAALTSIADGGAHIVVGTHALLSDSVIFARLGVGVVDEQHRFGVDQRSGLRAKGPGRQVPDLLFATATPIPRTAVMTVFGNLDCSVLDELPPGRTPIETSWVKPARAATGDPKAAPWTLIREQVQAGRQAFVVCPMVADSESKTAASAEGLAVELGTGALAGMSLAVVHGKQRPEERAAVMAGFASGVIDVLIATTVIEVGVNVPNATAMVIVGADRFGIAQLHQLRGRVGRGRHPGFCVLVSEAKTADATERMKALVACTDGFALSEIDLRLRGYGTLLGSAQSGTATDLRVADLLRDTDLVAWTREDAIGLLAADPKLARRPLLREEVARAIGAEARRWLVSG